MKKYSFIFLLFILGGSFCGKNVQTDSSNDSSNNLPPEEMNPPEGVKAIFITMGPSHACIVDDNNKAFCWLHSQKFVPSEPGSTRGGYEIDYPKKSNADLSTAKYLDIAGGGGESRDSGAICAVRSDNKILCFMPESVQTVSPADLSGLGKFKKVEATENGFFCAIDMNDILKCYKFDASYSIAKDDFFQAQVIAAIAVGTTTIGRSVKSFGCYITEADNLLHCELFDDEPKVESAKEEASKIISSGVSNRFSLASFSKDKKNIRYFGTNRRITTESNNPMDLSQKYQQIAVSSRVFCGILDPSGEIRCQQIVEDLLKKTNSDLQKDSFSSVSIGLNLGCGLHPDKSASCWMPNIKLEGVPKNLNAE